MEFLLVVQQTDSAAIAAQLDRIANVLTWVAILGGVVGLFAVASLVSSMFMLRSANKAIAAMEKHIDHLAPRLDPLIEKMTRLAGDSRDISDTIRRRVNDLMDSVADLNRGLKQATRGAELRVREFAAVLDVVKEEAEEVLIDTAATARGIQSAAETLRRPPPPPSRTARAEPEEEAEVAS